MSDEDHSTIWLRPPTQCDLWENPARADDEFEKAFDLIERFEDSSHYMRALLKCTDCGQLYFYEWIEWTNWFSGDDDKMYMTLFPVETEHEIELMKRASEYQLTHFLPSLHLEDTPRWFGKDFDKNIEK